MCVVYLYLHNNETEAGMYMFSIIISSKWDFSDKFEQDDNDITSSNVAHLTYSTLAYIMCRKWRKLERLYYKSVFNEYYKSFFKLWINKIIY